MVSDTTAHCHITGGELTEKNTTIESTLRSHNFVNKFNLIIPKSDFNKLSHLKLQSDNIIFQSTLSILLKCVLNITSDEELKSVKLLSVDTDVSHQLTISINNATLTMKIPSEIYFKSGLTGKLSNYSKGGKKINSQMFKITIDLSNFKEDFVNNNKNAVRLLWFADNVVKDQNFKFVAITTPELVGNLSEELDQNATGALQRKQFNLQNKDLGVCKIPNLEPQNDQDWLSSTLEWIAYASISGPQLSTFDTTDPYISNYTELLESESEENLVKFELSDGLISTFDILRIYGEAKYAGLKWFAFSCYGVKDCNVSFGKLNEHGFKNNGENDVVALVSEGSFVLWKIVASGDTA
ncbi:unnamed protein product [Ambrosiozyma monospora]|uniref:Unnamed protein product n=1 Tax=Ambrosiozyma monospora TaxID=43982 RepID=A0ACB5TG85_AMBMO|nr:unnamed protein product [Ambrosiozyma monospora]